MEDNNTSDLIIETSGDEDNKISGDDASITDDSQAGASSANPAGAYTKSNRVDRAYGSGGNKSAESGEQKDGFDKNRDFQNKLRRFKISSSGKLAEYRKREAYDSPSVKRKKKSKEARRRNSKKRSFSYGRRNGF